MKRVIKIKESDLVKIVKNILNEQPSPGGFQYKMGRAQDDRFQEPTRFTEIYFKKSGDSYMVYAKKPDSNMIGDTGIILPTEQQLLAKWDGRTEFVNEGGTIDGSDVAKSIMTNFKASQGNFIVYTKSDGVPAMGKFVLGYNQPIDVLVGEGLSEKSLKPGQVISLKDYIVVDRKRGFGRAMTIRDIVNAEVA